MLPYWLMFGVPAFLSLLNANSSLPPYSKRGRRLNLYWSSIGVVLICLIGFRYEVGGDWNNYFRYLLAVEGLEFWDILKLGDPGYYWLNFVSLNLGFGMTGVNILAASLFVPSLLFFCINQPRPMLALACAIPYLFIVVGMGYTRQAVALGFAMVGIIALQRGMNTKFFFWIFVAALFHKSAVILFPIAAFVNSNNRLQGTCSVIVMSLIGYYIFLESKATDLVETYTDPSIHSSGAMVRLAMNAIPGILFINYRNRLKFNQHDGRLWLTVSVLAVFFFVALVITGFTTALDRVSLYILPLQIVVFSRLPDALCRRMRDKLWLILAILAYFSLVLFVWLNFAANSYAWVPYSLGFTR